MGNIPNSMTVLHDLLPASLALSKRKLSGIYNFCNPGAISHNESLELYKKHVDPDYTWTNFTLEEQDILRQALEQRVGLLEAGQRVAGLGDPGDPRRGRPLLRAHEEEPGCAGLEADAARVLGVFPLGAAPKVVSVH